MSRGGQKNKNLISHLTLKQKFKGGALRQAKASSEGKKQQRLLAREALAKGRKGGSRVVNHRTPEARGASHLPVMLKEVLAVFNPQPGQDFIDATVGAAGHARAILGATAPGGRLLALEADPEMLTVARKNLAELEGRVTFVSDNFENIGPIIQANGFEKAAGVLFDLGLSTHQFKDPARGFSFALSGPLDMRLNPSQSQTAGQLLNRSSPGQLEEIFRDFGDLREARRLARTIVERRKQQPWRQTRELTQLASRIVREKPTIHPATRVFQALRVAVNRELEVLAKALTELVEALKEGAKIVVLAFHSGEDRVVKNIFRQLRAQEKLRLLTPKPLRASWSEVVTNPSARSVKLRAAEVILC